MSEYVSFVFDKPVVSSWAIYSTHRFREEREPVQISKITAKRIYFKRHSEEKYAELVTVTPISLKEWKVRRDFNYGRLVSPIDENEIPTYFAEQERKRKEHEEFNRRQQEHNSREDVRLARSISWFMQDDKQCLNLGIDKLKQIAEIAGIK